MSLRFALRPRYRLDESAEPPRPRRRKLPPVVLPIAAYWLAMAALTHVVILVGKSGASERPADSPWNALASESEEAPLERETADAPSEKAPAPEPPSLAPEPLPLAAAPPPAPTSEPTWDEELDLEPNEPPARAPKAPPQRDSAPPPTSRSTPSRSSLLAEPEPATERRVAREPRTEPRVAAEPARRAPPPIDEPAPASTEPAPVPAERASHSSGLPSCEAAAENASQDVDLERGGDRPADLPAEAFSRVLNHGSYLAACSIPEHTALDICVAVQAGRVRGVTVRARPHHPAVSACVARQVARLRFPNSPHLDIARTRFEAVR